MSDETLVLTFTKVEPSETKGGKRLHKAWDQEYLTQGYPCWSIWDADTGNTLLSLQGQPVTVKVNRDNADFPKVTKFLTVGGAAPGTPAATPPSPSPPARSSGAGTPAPAPVQAGSGGNTFKRDPLGVMLNLRQTALNCATQWLVSFNEKLPAADKLGTANLMKVSDQLFRHLVRGVEDALPIPQNGPETMDNGPTQTSDDDIPF